MKEFDVVIIGGGPAGLTAGIYAVRYGMSCLVVEKYFCGGQVMLTTEIKNYPGFIETTGQELSEKMKNHYLSYKGELMMGEVNNIDFENHTILVKNEEIKYKSIILAMGATARKLNLEKEKELSGRGISYCAICDGFFFKDKDVVVVGSGNSALEDSLYLADICKSVTVVSKHTNFVGQNIFIDQLKDKTNVKYYMGYTPTKIFGEETLSGIDIYSKTDDKTVHLDTEGMFVQIGRMPDNELVKGRVELHPAGFIKGNENMETNLPGVFVAGDIREKTVRQIVTACADGAIAANSAFKYISNI